MGAALWVAVCVALLLALVFYLVRRRPRVLPDEEGAGRYPYMIDTRPPATPVKTEPSDGDDDDDDDDDGIEVDVR